MPTAGRDDDSGDATARGSASRSLSDAQIAGITDLVNSSEIEQAELAQSKSNDPKVLSFENDDQPPHPG